MSLPTIGSPIAWAGFIAFVLVMLLIDLGVFHKQAHVVSLKESAYFSLAWFVLAALFGGGVYALFGPDRALEFATGYLLEKALAVDNIFVFVVVFSTFGIAAKHQHRVLFWGVLGALIMRALFILIGGAMLSRFQWMFYVFGAILAFTGIKLLFQREAESHPENNPIVKLFQRFFPVTHEHAEGKFFVRRDHRTYATPLLLALVALEVTDVVFAVDSIPAIFAITKDPFIVFTSNIFAILGLRSLYFLLAGVIDRFRYLKIGLAFVLILVAAKMLLLQVAHIPIVISLAVIALILAGSIAASLLIPPRPVTHPQ